ncbi:MAG: hypothetical protein PVF28_07265 [Thioalkalispiraceae bacterium]|jgi:hypothetical protein
MPGRVKAALTKVGMTKDKMARAAKQQVKKRTDELLDDDDLSTEIEFDEESLLVQPAEDGNIHLSARRKLEDYLEERRLRRAIEDDFDY